MKGPGSVGAENAENAENIVAAMRISRADVADFLARQLTDDAFVGLTSAIGY